MGTSSNGSALRETSKKNEGGTTESGNEREAGSSELHAGVERDGGAGRHADLDLAAGDDRLGLRAGAAGLGARDHVAVCAGGEARRELPGYVSEGQSERIQRNTPKRSR
jgi:hypothetical protein